MSVEESMQEQPLPPTGDGRVGPRVRWDGTTKVVVSVLLVVLAILAFYLFRIVFIPLIIGALMAYILSPVVRWISADPKVPRGLATALIYIILLILVIPLPASLIPWIVKQVTFLQGEFVNFVNYLDVISADTVSVLGFDLVVGDLVDEVTTSITGLLTSAAPASLTFVFNAAEVLLLIIFTFLVGFYLTKDSSKFKDWFKGLVPPSYREDAHLLVAEIDGIWSAFVRGQGILMVLVSVLLTAVSAVLGLPQPVLLGVLGGLMEFLPSIGHAIWLVTASVLALIEGSSTLPVSNFVLFIIVVVFHLAYTQFDLNFLIPHIIGRRVHLHPMIVIIGIIIGATAGHFIGGPVGSVLGVALAAPTISSARVVGRYVYARLFDMDPFPMVGPPSAPSEERVQAAAELAVQPPPSLNDVLGGRTIQLPHRRQHGSDEQTEPDQHPD